MHIQRPESVRAYAPPLRHPYFQTPREEQREAFRREVEESVRRSEALRARLKTIRVLESVQ